MKIKADGESSFDRWLSDLHCKLVDPVAIPDGMSVTVDEAGKDAHSGDVDNVFDSRISGRDVDVVAEINNGAVTRQFSLFL